MTSLDEKSVRDLYQRMMDGWNAGDGEAFAEPLADDADFVPFDGVPIKGRAAVVEFHRPLFQTYLRGTRLVGEVKSVRFLSDSVALMHAAGGTIMRGAKSPSRSRDSIQTLIAVRRDGRPFKTLESGPSEQTSWEPSWLIGDLLWKFVPASGRERKPLRSDRSRVSVTAS